MKKKLLSLLLSAAMVATMLAAAMIELPYVDVMHWREAAVVKKLRME